MLVHERGHLGPKTIDEWATPNGDEPLLLWMLRELERQGVERVELIAVRTYDERLLFTEQQAGYVEELRP
jgi:hypothetical protein